MAERDRPTVDVDRRGIEAELVDAGQRLRGEGLVRARRGRGRPGRAALGQGLAHAGHGADAHDARVDPGDGRREDAGHRPQAQGRARSASTTSTAGRPSLIRRRRGGDAALPGRKAGARLGEGASMRRVRRADACSARDEHGLAAGPAGHRPARAGRRSGRPRWPRPRALALEGEGVLALAAHVPVVGDALGGLAEGIAGRRR